MPLSNLSLDVKLSWLYEKTNTPFAKTKQGDDSISFSSQPAVGTYQNVKLASLTIAAGANTTLDLYAAFTNLVGETTAVSTKLLGVVLKLTGTNAQLKIEPGAANPLTWLLAGTTPSLTFRAGGVVVLVDGTAFTLSATDRNWKLSNPGAGDLTLVYGFILGS